MTKYVKKPVVIEAFQMTPERRRSNAEWPEWLTLAWQKHHNDVGSLWPYNFTETDPLCIRTLEGVMLVGWGDYIVQGIKGELYPCQADIFEATHEEVVNDG